ncbi:MAG: hypothetical protein ND895_08700 [Pyrinomonadaceae bacterium]|nr:hypothetical protein [Pyrinomonadaceae bacterium]
MKKILGKTLVQLVMIVSTTPGIYGALPQTINPVGKYVYKTYREGKGGFVNSLEIGKASGGKFHVSFEGTYLYMAGKDETFHEGSGEGDGHLNGNVLSANLDDGAGGICRLTITLAAGTASVKASPKCGLNVDPQGVYKKETTAERSVQASTAPAASAARSKGFEVCPDPNAPCDSRARKFAAYEMPFRLPANLKPGKEFNSAPFFGIIIKTYESEDCDADDHTASIERERIQIQKVYPTRKVFASYSCPNMDALTYDFPGLMDASGERALINTFIGVYAGQTVAQAKEFLVYVRTLYPQAVLKRMTVGYSIIEQ